jgi:ATP-dependent DNA helicase RecQ
MPELLDEIQNIVLSGTKLNLKTYINDIADEDIQDEVMDFFKKSEKDSLEEVLAGYGSEFSKEDLQLMRIHFISEVAY